MEICVDFDGTIVDHCYPEIGRPNPLAIDTMRSLIADGHKIILFTMRSGEKLQEAVDYLDSQGVSLYGINENPTQREWTESPKAYGQVYIDDAALGCPMTSYCDFKRECVDWLKVRDLLRERGIL